ncbi:MAG: MCE family protein [Methylococcaceae bacterium]|nr:MCE family protein [Methylococcaceae bacterium]
MGRETYAILTGAFLLVLGAVAVGVTIWLGHYNEERDVYLVVSPLPVSGLNPESNVYYRGVEIGKVKDIRFETRNGRNILARIEVTPNAPINLSTYAMLRVQPLTGLAQIELNDADQTSERLPTSAAQPARIPLRPSLVDRFTESGQDILQQSQELATKLNALLTEQNRRRVEHLVEGLDAFVQRLDRTVAELPVVRSDLRKTLGHIDDLAADMKRTSESIRKLAEATQGLAASGRQAGDTLSATSLPQLNALLTDLTVTTGHVRRLAAMLESDPQAVLLGPPPPPSGPGEPGFKEQP